MKNKLFTLMIAFATLVGVSTSFAEEAKKADAKPAAEKKDEKKADKKADKKASDADVLKEQADGLVKALQKSDVPAVLAFFADDFSSPMIKNKEALKAVLEMGANSGSFGGLTVDLAKSTYKIDGDKATIGPNTFDASGTTGTATITATKKDGNWKISGLDLTGVSF